MSIAPKGFANQKAYLDSILGSPIDCFDPKGCAFQNLGIPQVCYLNHTTAQPTTPFLPRVCGTTDPALCAQQCIGFFTEAIESQLIFSDAGPQDEQVRDSFCLTQPFDTAKRSGIETILSNDNTCSTTPESCTSGCEGKGVACCTGNASTLLQCDPNPDGTYNGYFQCEPFSCDSGFTYFNGNCYRSVPVPTGNSGSPCCSADINDIPSVNPAIGNCGPQYSMYCNPPSHGGCLDNLSQIPSGSWYCTHSGGIDDNGAFEGDFAWAKCTDPNGCQNPVYADPSLNWHWYFNMSDDTCGAIPSTLQYCPWPPPQ